MSLSACFASLRALSAVSSMKAWMRLSCASMRFSRVSTYSTGESFFAAMRAEASGAGIQARSVGAILVSSARVKAGNAIDVRRPGARLDVARQLAGDVLGLLRSRHHVLRVFL